MLSKALQAAAGNAGGEALFVDSVFSTYLYTGNGSTQTITNGIDLAGEGGATWIKSRSAAYYHNLFDTERGAGWWLFPNDTSAQGLQISRLSAFNSDGFSLGNQGQVNESGQTYASWTFRKAPKFFDVVTWTGNTTSTAGTVYRQLSHSLGSAPGTIIVKNISTAKNWPVYHRSLPTSGNAGGYLFLNTTGALNYTASYFPTAGYVGSNGVTAAYNSTVFTAGEDINQTGNTYVAYLFAHDAGGFGADGSENVISCGSYTGNGSATGPVVTLGYEPQWVLVKNASVAGNNWLVFDTMRGMSFSQSAYLRPNTIDVETSGTGWIIPQATGFQLGTTVSSINGSGSTYIYIAIRRPMKPPSAGTEAFSPNATSATTGTVITTGFPVDLQIASLRGGSNHYVMDRLRGVSSSGETSLPQLQTNSTSAESNASLTRNFTNTGFEVPSWSSGSSQVLWNFKRASGFFDVVCYTGTGVARTVNHNLTVAPEMMIVKSRSSVSNWPVYHSAIGNTGSVNLNGNSSTGGGFWNSTSPGAATFTVGDQGAVNGSAQTYVAYLFATVAGVSKVGSYTGTGTTKQVNCGFTSGARFVLIRRTDSTGDWYVWDSARGIVAGNDPYLLLNSSAAEVTNTDYIDTYSAGFEITSTAPAAINANGGSFIYLAIA